MYARTNGMNPVPCPAPAFAFASPCKCNARKFFDASLGRAICQIGRGRERRERQRGKLSFELCFVRACFVNQNYVTFCIRCRSMDVINTLSLYIYSIVGAACEPSNG